MRWGSGQGKDAIEGFACVIVHRDPTLIVELSERDMERKLVAARVTQGVPLLGTWTAYASHCL